eukprot:TRINITY_DN63538_c0_g4_i1.p1 TRINITY_DN63538_c0_g4~~TRINITY_DN63538_c0_g4_i1.p1  ORF type:complete len:1294 (+),score=192.04 TRINITY_DN63538_c0_g4_i1:133-4014(+)
MAFFLWEKFIIVILILVGTTSLTVFFILEKSLTRKTIRSPSYGVYTSLSSDFPDIKCSCAQDVLLEEFLTFHAKQIHPCSSNTASGARPHLALDAFVNQTCWITGQMLQQTSKSVLQHSTGIEMYAPNELSVMTSRTTRQAKTGLTNALKAALEMQFAADLFTVPLSLNTWFGNSDGAVLVDSTQTDGKENTPYTVGGPRIRTGQRLVPSETHAEFGDACRADPTLLTVHLDGSAENGNEDTIAPDYVRRTIRGCNPLQTLYHTQPSTLLQHSVNSKQTDLFNFWPTLYQAVLDAYVPTNSPACGENTQLDSFGSVGAEETDSDDSEEQQNTPNSDETENKAEEEDTPKPSSDDDTENTSGGLVTKTSPLLQNKMSYQQGKFRINSTPTSTHASLVASAVNTFNYALTQTECAKMCPADWRADSKCDPDCNVEACEFDGGDCDSSLPECPASCSRSWLGDGLCDAECNTAGCKWDQGDCSVPECSKGCPVSWLGDGWCDTACDVAACHFDKRDCESPSNEISGRCAPSDLGPLSLCLSKVSCYVNALDTSNVCMDPLCVREVLKCYQYVGCTESDQHSVCTQSLGCGENECNARLRTCDMEAVRTCKSKLSCARQDGTIQQCADADCLRQWRECYSEHGCSVDMAISDCQGACNTAQCIESGSRNAPRCYQGSAGWVERLDYEKYFKKCTPSQCSWIEDSTKPMVDILVAFCGILAGVTLIVVFIIHGCIVSFLYVQDHNRVNDGTHAHRERLGSGSITSSTSSNPRLTHAQMNMMGKHLPPAPPTLATTRGDPRDPRGPDHNRRRTPPPQHVSSQPSKHRSSAMDQQQQENRQHEQQQPDYENPISKISTPVSPPTDAVEVPPPPTSPREGKRGWSACAAAPPIDRTPSRERSASSKPDHEQHAATENHPAHQHISTPHRPQAASPNERDKDFHNPDLLGGDEWANSHNYDASQQQEHTGSGGYYAANGTYVVDVGDVEQADYAEGDYGDGTGDGYDYSGTGDGAYNAQQDNNKNMTTTDYSNNYSNYYNYNTNTNYGETEQNTTSGTAGLGGYSQQQSTTPNATTPQTTTGTSGTGLTNAPRPYSLLHGNMSVPAAASGGGYGASTTDPVQQPATTTSYTPLTSFGGTSGGYGTTADAAQQPTTTPYTPLTSFGTLGLSTTPAAPSTETPGGTSTTFGLSSTTGLGLTSFGTTDQTTTPTLGGGSLGLLNSSPMGMQTTNTGTGALQTDYNNFGTSTAGVFNATAGTGAATGLQPTTSIGRNTSPSVANNYPTSTPTTNTPALAPATNFGY